MRIERETLVRLRESVLQSSAGVDVLREAGYAGGNSLFQTFEEWSREKHGGEVLGLPLAEFSERCADFFSSIGWGRLTVKEGENGTAIAEIEDCWEREGSDQSGCHITTGLLSAFFGKIADHPLAVLELTESSAASCKFALGNAGTIQQLANSYANAG